MKASAMLRTCMAKLKKKQSFALEPLERHVVYSCLTKSNKNILYNWNKNEKIDKKRRQRYSNI